FFLDLRLIRNAGGSLRGLGVGIRGIEFSNRQGLYGRGQYLLASGGLNGRRAGESGPQLRRRVVERHDDFEILRFLSLSRNRSGRRAAASGARAVSDFRHVTQQ